MLMWNVRCEAAALGNAAYRPAGPSFLRLLNYENWEARKATALGLMKIGEVSAIASLQTALGKESEASVKPIYTLAISQLGDQSNGNDDWD